MTGQTRTGQTSRRATGPIVIAACLIVFGCGCTISGTPTAEPTLELPPMSAGETPDEPWAHLPSLSPTEAPSTPTTAVAPPPDAQTMLCRDYATSDDATQEAVVKANGVTKNPALVASLVAVLCLPSPDQRVRAVIDGLSDDITHK